MSQWLTSPECQKKKVTLCKISIPRRVLRGWVTDPENWTYELFSPCCALLTPARCPPQWKTPNTWGVSPLRLAPTHWAWLTGQGGPSLSRPEKQLLGSLSLSCRGNTAEAAQTLLDKEKASLTFSISTTPIC